jgi:hypothetical protein
MENTMSKKKLFWIAFFSLTLLEVGQMAYSHDKDITVMVSMQTPIVQCDRQDNSEQTKQHLSVFGRAPIMLI